MIVYIYIFISIGSNYPRPNSCCQASLDRLFLLNNISIIIVGKVWVSYIRNEFISMYISCVGILYSVATPENNFQGTPQNSENIYTKCLLIE